MIFVDNIFLFLIFFLFYNIFDRKNPINSNKCHINSGKFHQNNFLEKIFVEVRIFFLFESTGRIVIKICLFCIMLRLWLFINKNRLYRKNVFNKIISFSDFTVVSQDLIQNLVHWLRRYKMCVYMMPIYSKTMANKKKVHKQNSFIFRFNVCIPNSVQFYFSANRYKCSIYYPPPSHPSALFLWHQQASGFEYHMGPYFFLSSSQNEHLCKFWHHNFPHYIYKYQYSASD